MPFVVRRKHVIRGVRRVMPVVLGANDKDNAEVLSGRWYV